MTNKTSAAEKCESVLLKIKTFNQQKNIYPTENLIIDQMLARREELLHAYDEIHKKLSHSQNTLWAFFDGILGATYCFNPDRTSQLRQEKKELIEVNEKINCIALKLSDLLFRRGELENFGNFTSNTNCDVIDIIKEASWNNPHFENSVKSPLESIQYQFDSKYWPTIDQCIFALALNAGEAEVRAGDKLTSVATSTNQASKSDFVISLLEHIKDLGKSNSGFFPENFSLSGNAVATLTNCLLNLEPDKLVTAEYVKNIRSRHKKRNKNS